MKFFSMIRKWLSASTLALVLAVGLAGYGVASLLAPGCLDTVADLLGLFKVPEDSGIDDGSV
jgi:hypothetical protein